MSGPQDRKNRIGKSGVYGSSNLDLTCAGVNFSSLYGNKLDQYPEVLEQLVQDAPGLAMMYVAYTQPLLKGVVDELNTTLDEFISLTGLTCGDLSEQIKEGAEASPEAKANNECASSEGGFSLDCMENKQQLIVDDWNETKNEWKDSTKEYLDKIIPKDIQPGKGGAGYVTDLTCYDTNGDNITHVLLAAGAYDCNRFEKTEALIATMTLQSNPNGDGIVSKPPLQSVTGYFNESAAFYLKKLDIILKAPYEEKRLKNNAQYDDAIEAYEELSSKLGRSLASKHIQTLARSYAKTGQRDGGVNLYDADETAKINSVIQSMPRYWAYEEIRKEVPLIIASLNKGAGIAAAGKTIPFNKIKEQIDVNSKTLLNEMLSLDEQWKGMTGSIKAVNELISPISEGM
jgi:hypothetical protein